LPQEDDPVQDRRKPGILVVDGDATVRALLHCALDRHEFAVALAADGAEALRLLRHAPGRFAIVLVELHLDDQDGLDVLKEIRQIDPAVHRCIITGYLGRYTEDELRASGTERIFYKPFSLEEVAGLLQRIAADNDCGGVLSVGSARGLGAAPGRDSWRSGPSEPAG
jgi:ActR/RegA family two-component response regulator